MARKQKQSFDGFYREMFGPRWNDLKQALLREQHHYKFTHGLIKPYYLDYASVLAAEELCVCPGNVVLDMCAAPGGKSLILATRLQGEGLLICNDRSRARSTRLSRVLREHLPEGIQGCIRVTGYDGRTWGVHEQDRFDRILLDVPCSSERHVLHSPHYLKQWSSFRSRYLGGQAYALLVSALTACRPGGIILYTTCTISRLENDDVIRKLYRKKEGLFTMLSIDHSVGEAGEFGRSILPDRENNIGPLYMAKLQKR